MVIFGITLTPAATVFPLLIGVLIPFRLYVLPNYLDAEVIEHLDPYDKVPGYDCATAISMIVASLSCSSLCLLCYFQ